MKISEQLVLSGGVTGELVEFAGGDVPDIIQLERRANPYPWSEHNFHDSVKSSHICVGVKARNHWVAHAVFSRAAGEAELLILAVDPAWRNQGIAREILTRLAARLAMHCDMLFLEVRESNLAAINLYESLGFNCVGTRPNYYPAKDGRRREDAFIYALNLTV